MLDRKIVEVGVRDFEAENSRNGKTVWAGRLAPRNSELAQSDILPHAENHPLLLAPLAFTVSLTAQTLLVANLGDRTISVVDVATRRQVGVIRGIDEKVPGPWFHEIAISPDGRTAYVPTYAPPGAGPDSGKTLVIDIPNRKIKATVDFGPGLRPHFIVYDPHSDLLYLTPERAGSVTIVDPQTLKVVGNLPTGGTESAMLAISHDGKRGYAANLKLGTVSVLDMASRKNLAVIPVAAESERIFVSNDDKWVFATDVIKPRVAVIDAATYKVSSWIDLPSRGLGTASTTDDRLLLVAMPWMAQADSNHRRLSLAAGGAGRS